MLTAVKRTRPAMTNCTTAHAPFGLQVSAKVAALDAIVATYCGFLSSLKTL
jgi:hypothetical protein